MKNNVDRAYDVLAEAESSLRALIEASLADEDYGAVAKIAEMADTVAELGDSRLGGSLDDPPTVPSQAAGEYPRFERDGDDIVKVGWSSKHNEEYMQRAPRAVLMTVAEVLRERNDIDEFSVAGLLRLRIPAFSRVPDYQVYLAVKFFRNAGAVLGTGKGRRKVVAVKDQLSPEKLKDYWQALHSSRR